MVTTSMFSRIHRRALVLLGQDRRLEELLFVVDLGGKLALTKSSEGATNRNRAQDLQMRHNAES